MTTAPPPHARLCRALSLVLGSASLVLGWGAAVATASSPGAIRAAASAGDRPLLAVSCVSARDCTAVGGLFAEHWDGRRWSLHPVATRDASETRFDYLGGVSCAAPRACLAVGSERPPLDANAGYAYSPLAEAWRGGGWSDKSPAPSQTPNDYLQAVSCPSASDCIGVGQGVAAVLAMGWNGHDWAVQLAPTNAPGMSILNGVSCTSPARCVAVGYFAPNPIAPFRVLVERWNGRTWSTMPTPRTSAVQSALLNAVSCTGRTCTAVGSVGYNQLVERWNGRRWSIQRAPKGAPGAALNGVSCVSPKACVAVGALTHRGYRSIAERWNGSRWSIQRTPTPASGALLWGVSCPTAADCVAVGQRQTKPLIERWNGTRWSIQPTG